MIPLNIRREIQSIRGRPGDNFLARALEQLETHVNDLVATVSAIKPQGVVVSPAQPSPAVPSTTIVQQISGGGGGGGLAGQPLPLPPIGGVNAQTGITYTLDTTDYGKLITFLNAAAVTFNLPKGGGLFNGFFCVVENLGDGVVTITPDVTSPATLIDGAATLSLNKNQGIVLYSDGENWFTERGLGGGGVIAGGVNIQTGTSYTIQASDNAKLVVFNNPNSVAVTLPAANTRPQFYCVVENIGAGKVTITPTAGSIDGGSYITLGNFMGAWLFADKVGNNWYAENGMRVSGVNSQSGDYTTLPSDEGKLISENSSSPAIVNLSCSAGYFNYFVGVENVGAGVVTLSPASGTIDGAASLALNHNQGCMVYFDGTNWFTMRGIGGAGGGGVNLQSGTTYTIQASDNGKLVSIANSAAMAIDLPDASLLVSPFFCAIENRGTALLTITAAVGTIDGAVSLILYAGQGILIYSNSANWYTERGMLNAGPVSSLTATSYTLHAYDMGGLVTMANGSPMAITLPDATTLGYSFWCSIENRGTALLTLTPSSGTIDGAGSLVVPQNQGVVVFFNGTNWFTMRGLSASGGVSGSPSSGINLCPGVGYTLSSALGGMAGWSFVVRISGAALVWTANSWKLRLEFYTKASPIALTFGAIVVRRTAQDDIFPIDSTSITIGGSGAPTISIPSGSGTPFVVTTDAINLPLDTDHDYWIIAYVSVDHLPYALIAYNSSGQMNCNFQSYIVGGDQTAAVSYPGLSANVNYLIANMLAA
jgi:hypothetical protein